MSFRFEYKDLFQMNMVNKGAFLTHIWFYNLKNKDEYVPENIRVIYCIPIGGNAILDEIVEPHADEYFDLIKDKPWALYYNGVLLLKNEENNNLLISTKLTRVN